MSASRSLPVHPLPTFEQAPSPTAGNQGTSRRPATALPTPWPDHAGAHPRWRRAAPSPTGRASSVSRSQRSAGSGRRGPWPRPSTCRPDRAPRRNGRRSSLRGRPSVPLLESLGHAYAPTTAAWPASSWSGARNPCDGGRPSRPRVSRRIGQHSAARRSAQVRIGVVGRPSRSTPRTECQKVLMATPEIAASSGLGERAVYGAGDEVEKLVGVFRRAAVGGVLELVVELDLCALHSVARAVVESGPHRRGAHVHREDPCVLQFSGFHRSHLSQEISLSR